MSKEGLQSPSDLLTTHIAINQAIHCEGLTMSEADIFLRFYSFPVLSPYQFRDLLTESWHIRYPVNRLMKKGFICVSGMKKTKKRPARLYCLTEKGSKVLADLVKIIEGK